MKEKHPFYRSWIAIFCVLIALGALLFIYSVVTGYGAGEHLLRFVTL